MHTSFFRQHRLPLIAAVAAVIALTGFAAPLRAQSNNYTDAVLFAAYLKNDMAVWDRYLHAVNFDHAPQAEKLRYLNYEYGYVATAIDEKAADRDQHIANFEKHIAALKGVLPEATRLDYESSLAAYKGLNNKAKFISCGIESYKTINAAYAIDSMDPMVLTLKGNVDLYAPKAIGGNKPRAALYFARAVKIYEQRGDTVNNWNYLSSLNCSIQAAEELGQIEKAVNLARKLLKRYPTYAILRDTYLPKLEEKLRQKQAKKK